MGLQFGPYEPYTVMVIIGLILYGIAFVFLLLSYYFYTKGSPWFERMRIFVRLALAPATIFPVIFTYKIINIFKFLMVNTAAVFFACNYATGYLANFPTVQCWVPPNIIYAIIGVIVLIIQTVLQIFATYAITDTTIGRSSSFFAINSFFYLVVENSGCLLIPAIYRIAFQSLKFMRPVLVMLQAAISFAYLIKAIPFYKARTNSFYAGYTCARFFGSILTFTSVFANADEDQPIGIALSVTLLCVMVIAFIVGFICMELYQLYVIRKCLNYETILNEQNESGIKTISTRNLEIGLRLFSSRGEEKALHMEKIVKSASLHNIETNDLLIQRAVIQMFISKSVTYSSLCLQKALSYRPNILMRFIIFLRQQDLEIINSEQNNKRRTTRLIDNGKRMESDLQYYQRQFWKNLVNPKTDLNLLGKFAHLAFTAESECERIFNGLITKYPKNVQIVRVFAQYLENVKHRPEEAEAYYAEAESLEEQEQLRLRQKRKALEENQEESQQAEPLVMHRSNADDDNNSITKRRIATRTPFPHRSSIASSILNHRMSTASVLMGDDIEAISDSISRKSNQNRETYHKQLMIKDNKYLLRAGVLSIIAAMIVTTIVVGAVIESKLKFSDTNIMVDGCRMGMLPMKLLDQWRNYQMELDYANKSSKLTIVNVFTL
jgi:hypothetical protein